MKHCSLCRESSQENYLRIASLDICDQCFYDSSEERLQQHRQWSTFIREYEIYDKERTLPHIYLQMHITIPIPKHGIAPLRMHARRWNPLNQILRLLFWPVLTGDSLYDKTAYTTSQNKRLAKKFLSTDGVQSIILDILGDTSSLRINKNTVQIHHKSEDYLAPQTILVKLAILAHYLESLNLSL